MFRDNLSVPCPGVQEERLPNTTLPSPKWSLAVRFPHFSFVLCAPHTPFTVIPGEHHNLRKSLRNSLDPLATSSWGPNTLRNCDLPVCYPKETINSFSIITTILPPAKEKILEAEGPPSSQDVNLTRRWRKGRGEPQWLHASWLTARATPF